MEVNGQFQTPTALSPEKESLAPFEEKAGRAPEPV